MPTQVFNTGTCFVYAGIGTQGSPVFIGTGERAPRQMIQRFWSPVFNDLAGDQDSFDDLYEGQRGRVAVRLTRPNYPALLAMQSTPFALGAPVTPGTDFLGDVGTAMMTEGALYPLWILYDYGASGRFPKAAQILNGLPPGRRWFGARLESPDDETRGTQSNVTDLVWTCKRVYDPVTGRFGLYDTNTAGLPAPD